MKTTLLMFPALMLSLASGVAHANNAPLHRVEIARTVNARSDNPASRAYLIEGVTPGKIKVGPLNANGVLRWRVFAEKRLAPRSNAVERVLMTGILRQLRPRLGNPAGGVRIRVTSVTPEGY
jgi:hypothetical protein